MRCSLMDGKRGGVTGGCDGGEGMRTTDLRLWSFNL